MSEWKPESFVSSEAQPPLDNVGSGPGSESDRVLQNTSGNAQSYTDPAIVNGNGVSREEQYQPLDLKYPQPPAVVQESTTPATTSAQDDKTSVASTQGRKLRRLQSAAQPIPVVRPKRSYMNSRKYLEYRARPRRDTGKDGEPVWSDQLEDAFQQGELLYISRNFFR
ncbi:hypothetical protein VTN31DRAFT_1922 [Thermomyces dupontii]|uniref:uncharacterized protein n=1 Tax=Talaromyces thermophilus TaxID=28565 RepID=UPI003742E1E2